MNAIEQAIKEAVDKGEYEPFKTVKMAELTCELHGDHFGCNFNPLPNGATVRGICGVSLYKILLDPVFWQSLGRARGEIDANWPNGEMRCQNKLGRCDARYCEYGGYKNPKDRAMQFFEWIMDGNDTGSFFADLDS